MVQHGILAAAAEVFSASGYRAGKAGDVRAELERMAGQPDTDPEPVAWLLLSVLSTRAFRAVVTPGPDRVEAGVTALALRLLAPGD